MRFQASNRPFVNAWLARYLVDGVATTIVYDAIVSFIILKVVDLVIGLRVPEEVERDGLDIALHGESVS